MALYPTFQKYFRTHKPPLLAVWGRNDPFFLPPGAEAFKRDIPGRGSSLLRHRPFRTGNPRPGNCRKHLPFPGVTARRAGIDFTPSTERLR